MYIQHMLLNIYLLTYLEHKRDRDFTHSSKSFVTEIFSWRGNFILGDDLQAAGGHA